MQKTLFDANTNLALLASAGTGKTRTLSLRFLDLYLKYENIASIYALTFTNKASREMQERIVRYLDILCTREKFIEPVRQPRQYRGGNLANEEEREIAETFGLRFKDITKKARRLKHQLLSNFSDFNVSTIHSFLNSILKTIPFQADVLPDFRIIETAEENILIDKVIDEFLNNAIDKSDYKTLINEVLGKKHRDTKNTIKNMFLSLLPRMLEIREILTMNQACSPVPTISGGSWLENFKEEKPSIDIVCLQQDCLKIIKLLKNGDCGNNKNLEKKIETIERLFKCRAKEDLIEEIMDLFNKNYFKKLKENPRIGPELKSIALSIHCQAKEFALLNNRKLLFDNLKLFFAIHNRFQDAKKDVNVVTFSDLENYALKALSNSQTKEYLYFKSSSQIEHLLIDEFQDISIIQWEILEPIVEEIIAGQNHSFFYVGDPNQSIYRFRGGESRLFDHIKNKFPGKIQSECLSENYRSKEEIVSFINSVFSSVPGHQPMKSMQIPNRDCCEAGRSSGQEQGGWVVVENIGEYGQKEGAEASGSKVIKAVKILKKRGYNYNDIALLVRRNQTGIKLSKILEKAGIPTKSESKSSLIYQEGIYDVINLLRWLTNPCEDFYLSLALLSPLFCIEEKRIETLRTKKGYGLLETLKNKYPDWKATKKLQKILEICDFVSPYELISFIYSELNVMGHYKHSGAFSALLELAYKFENEKGNSLSLFIEYLQQYGQTLEFPGSEINGVQILTCHKAKGLEFPVVLLPETVWNMEGIENDQFVFEYGKTSAEFTLNNIYYRKDILLKLFQKEIFQDEKKRVYDDELNNLYVAMTRAKEGLWIIGYDNNRLSKTWFDFITKSAKISMENNIYKAGHIQDCEKSTKKKRKSFVKIEKFAFYPKQKKIIIPIKEKAIISDEQRNILKWGEICHYALSKIGKVNERNLEETIHLAIDNTKKMYSRSQEEQKEIAEKLEPVLKDILTDKDLEFIFNLDDKVKVKIETPIYFKKTKVGILKRTDRLLIRDDLIEIIDYKTGEKPATTNWRGKPTYNNSSRNKQYLKQMRDYKLGVSKIYPDKKIKCYLIWLDNPKGKRIGEV